MEEILLFRCGKCRYNIRGVKIIIRKNQS